MDSSLVALIVADLTQRSVLEHVLRREGFDVTSHGGGASFRSAARAAVPDAVLLDASLPEAKRGSLVPWIQGLHPGTSLLLLYDRSARQGDLEPARLGPATALAPLEPGHELLLSLRGALTSSRLALRVRSLERRNSGATWAGVVGRSQLIRGLEDRLDAVAGSEVRVHLHGEPGVGKGLVARALHSVSGRREGALVSLDGAGPEDRWIQALLGPKSDGSFESEPESAGAVAGAAGGTLVLRRLEELGPRGQEVLLHVVRSRGGTQGRAGEAREPEPRLILIHPRPLSEAVEEGRVWEDVERELRGVEVWVPPLRERPDDILLLADHFARLEAPNRMPIRVTKEAAAGLVRYRWPGNVRELRDVIRRALLICDDEIGLEDLPQSIRRDAGPDDAPGGGRLEPPEGLHLRALERWAIRRAVDSCDGNMTEASAMLGIGRTTLYRKLDAYGLR